ncbi:tRNA-uridine aminocarboxypropyltransferase [Pseudomonas sp. NPDC089395]|uniref:tRNA-uridine aminocarboxypropyltransferase n=1 Tax=Pseudomonas sp. NPDC089395 TaxID=3364460 RepID=UPI003810C29A
MPSSRCERCKRPRAHCLCAHVPNLDSRTRVLILQHIREKSHALNTAHLAALGLANAQLHVGVVFEQLDRWLATPGYQPVVLFPGDQAQILSSAPPAEDLPLLLIVPDGTWRTARKLLQLNPQLQALPRMMLQVKQPSRYRLRKAPAPEALSTIEAVVQALNVLEQPACFDELLRPFEALIEGQIRAMGIETFERNHGESGTA